MAASGDGPVKWPGPVTFDDNRPKTGFIKLHLKVPKLKVSGGFFGAAKAKNADVKVEIEKEHVCITVSMNEGDIYKYDKQMPENINAKKSKCEVKDGKLEVVLCKDKDISWGAHSSYLIKKT